MCPRGVIPAAIVAVLLVPTPSRAQGIPQEVVGWYNGDWKPLIPGIVSWQAPDGQFARLYDDVVVPDGGWTVVGVFGHIATTPVEFTQAFWEIRSGVSAGNGGKVVASGLSPATSGRTQSVGGGQEVYLVQVSGLWVQLPAGKYWVTLAPVTGNPQTYISATVGANAIGEPKGSDGAAYLTRSTGMNFVATQSTGSGGTSGDYSLGLTISGATASRETSWKANFDALTTQMMGMHSIPFPGVSTDQFKSRASDVAARAAGMSDAEVRTNLQALVASIGDPHTDVIWPTPRPFRFLPLSLYWFDDGVYITAAPSQHRQILGAKVTGIGMGGIDEAVARLTPLVAHDNDSWLKQVLAANKFTNADFLFGTGITADTAGADLQVELPSGERRTVRVDALDQSAFPSLAPAYQGPLPLYRQHPEKVYWATTIDAGQVVYFQYNSCMEDPAEPSARFFQQLDEMLARPEVRKLVVDLRMNSGGTTVVLNPWFERLKASRFNQRGRLFVIVGRATYSAAMEHSNRFREETAAIFVGEPAGGKPRFLLRKGDFGLPYFGIRVSYSQGVERADDPGPTLMPDIRTPVTFENYMRGVDPALDAIVPIERMRPRPR